MVLDGSETGPAAMRVAPAAALPAMKTKGLKAELAARGARQAGLKAPLQRWLHGLLMADAVARAAKDAAEWEREASRKRLHAEIFGSDSDSGSDGADSSDV